MKKLYQYPELNIILFTDIITASGDIGDDDDPPGIKPGGNGTPGTSPGA